MLRSCSSAVRDLHRHAADGIDGRVGMAGGWRCVHGLPSIPYGGIVQGMDEQIEEIPARAPRPHRRPGARRGAHGRGRPLLHRRADPDPRRARRARQGRAGDPARPPAALRGRTPSTPATNASGRPRSTSCWKCSTAAAADMIRARSPALWMIAAGGVRLAPPAMTVHAMAPAGQRRDGRLSRPLRRRPPPPCPENDSARHAAGLCCPLMADAVARAVVAVVVDGVGCAACHPRFRRPRPDRPVAFTRIRRLPESEPRHAVPFRSDTEMIMLFRRSVVGVLGVGDRHARVGARPRPAMSGGRPGDPAKATRTVEIVATDNAFSLKALARARRRDGPLRRPQRRLRSARVH